MKLLAAGRDVALQTGGDLQLLAAVETNYRSVQRHQRTRHMVEDLNFELDETRALLFTITAGNDLTIQATDGNLDAIGSALRHVVQQTRHIQNIR